MVACSIRCFCNGGPPGCATHVDPGPTPTTPPVVTGFTVSVCYPEIPGHSCSPVEAPFHSPSLEGPVPADTAHRAEFDASRFVYVFSDVVPGNYILREDGCNPFGCWLDTPVTVADQDVAVSIQQLGPQPSGPLPTLTPTPIGLCLGDANEDDRVTIDELVRAVNHALSGCP